MSVNKPGSSLEPADGKSGRSSTSGSRRNGSPRSSCATVAVAMPMLCDTGSSAPPRYASSAVPLAKRCTDGLVTKASHLAGLRESEQQHVVILVRNQGLSQLDKHNMW